MSNEVQERWQEIVGVKGKPDPNSLADFSGSSGDRERGKFRPSQYPRLYTSAVVNDDGTPVAGDTNTLLAGVIESIGKLSGITNSLLRATELVDALSILVSPSVFEIFETSPIMPVGIGTGSVYAALDAIGTTAVRIAVPPSGIIQGAVYYDRDDEGLPVNLWLFDDDVADQTDNSAFTTTDGDLVRVIDVIEFSSGFLDATNGQVLIGSNLQIPYKASEGFIWCQLQAMGALNIAAGSEPIFKLRIQPS